VVPREKSGALVKQLARHDRRECILYANVLIGVDAQIFLVAQDRRQARLAEQLSVSRAEALGIQPIDNVLGAFACGSNLYNQPSHIFRIS